MEEDLKDATMAPVEEDVNNEPSGTMKRDVLLKFADLCKKTTMSAAGVPEVVRISEYLTDFWSTRPVEEALAQLCLTCALSVVLTLTHTSSGCWQTLDKLYLIAPHTGGQPPVRVRPQKKLTNFTIHLSQLRVDAQAKQGRAAPSSE